jgi:hypothetical protein
MEAKLVSFVISLSGVPMDLLEQHKLAARAKIADVPLGLKNDLADATKNEFNYTHGINRTIMGKRAAEQLSLNCIFGARYMFTDETGAMTVRLSNPTAVIYDLRTMQRI